MQERDSFSDFTIRPSIPADAEAVWRCLNSVARERRHIAMVEPPTLEEVHSFLGTLADRGVIQFVALAGSKVVGWCDVTRKPIEGFRHSGVLGMGLLQAYRRRGLGSALLRAVLAEAQSQPSAESSLRSIPPTNLRLPSNSASGLYARASSDPPAS